MDVWRVGKDWPASSERENSWSARLDWIALWRGLPSPCRPCAQSGDKDGDRLIAPACTPCPHAIQFFPAGQPYPLRARLTLPAAPLPPCCVSRERHQDQLDRNRGIDL